jgi:hypothetical protein
MLELYPEINEKIDRLNSINTYEDKWEEKEEINKYLIEND